MSDAAELEASLRAVEPRWKFVTARELAKVHRGQRATGQRTPPNPQLPLLSDDLVLVTSPTERGMAYRPLSQQLLHYWRWLYAIRVLPPNAEAVWQALPRVQKRDLEVVLKATGSVLPDASDSEFAAAFAIDLLTCARFAAEELEYRYPSLTDWPEWRAKLCEGFDEAGIFFAARPVGAAETHIEIARPVEEIAVSEPVAGDARRAFARAQSAASAMEKGNNARAAILYSAASKACSKGSTKYRIDAKEALRVGLVERLAPVLNWGERQKSEWNLALQSLLAPAAEGHWSSPAKALYDLQKIAVELEGDAFAVDPWGWAGNFGRKPLLRKLTLAKLAILHRRLLKVKHHLLNSRLAAAEFDPLAALLDGETHRAEMALREALEPILLRTLGEVGFVPVNAVEEIALRKIVDELLDRTVEQGYFRLGDLRDTLARNQVKMPDLAGAMQLVRGDALLQADKKLGDALDGVYYPGEIYLRWFQRGSAVAFGTKPGRWFSLWIAAPFGAAFMTVEFAKYMVHEVSSIGRFFSGLFDSELAAKHAAEHEHKSHEISMSPESIAIVLILGFLYLGLIHSKAMRSGVFKLIGEIGRGLGWLFGTLPGEVWESAPVRAIRENPAVRWFNRRLAIPFLGAGAVALVAAQFDMPWEEYWWEVSGTFAFLVLVLNTPGGQLLQERIATALTWCWRQIRTNFFPGLIGWTAWFFRGLLGGLDRLIYSIDEWFRFRPGQPKPSLWLKVALASIWFPVRYSLRFAIHLLIEPQINPIKHFPVVTVSHKLLLPMIPAISTATGIPKQWVTLAMSGVPGIFGFLAWELKENWRLYAANRPPKLKPLALGHHGETMRGLLRPGFHSGTIPKAYGAIRRALEKAEVRGEPAKIHKSREVLHHVEEAIHHFTERELLAYLRSTKAWGGVPLHCERVTLGLRHIRIDIRGTGGVAAIRFELIDSQIRAECEDAVFLKGTTEEQRECWTRAVLGFGAMGAAPSDDPRLSWDEWVSFWEAAR